MRGRVQVLAGPVPLAAASEPAFLATLLTADVLVRRAVSAGGELEASTAVLGRGLGDEYAAEEELLREGLDKNLVGRHGFVGRVDAVEQRARSQLADVAGRLGIGVGVEGARSPGDQAARAACTAFVRLFDAGLLQEAERVVEVCPRCGTAATGLDAIATVLEGERLLVRLSLVEGAEPGAVLDVPCLAPELLPGVVAVAVPEGHPAAGTTAAVPLAAVVVPVVPDPAVEGPVLLVPGHDADALVLARRLGLAAVAVVDAAGVVSAPGPLAGLARFGARAVARRLLAGEGALAGAEPAPEPAARCSACRTVLVPVLGRHWFLGLADLELAAADAVRDVRLAVSPPSARDDLLARAGEAAEWCLSRQLWTGQALPVARCIDCGQVDVSVELAASCRRCMGTLVPDDGVLDARFVRCVWPLSEWGWPDGGRGPAEAAGGTLLVLPAERLGDVLPMVALGLRLSGDVPFGEVVVVGGGVGGGTDGGDEPPLDAECLMGSEHPRVLRVALLGGVGVDEARRFVAGLDAMPPGGADVDRLEEACTAAFEAATPASVVALITAALADGVPPVAAARVRALAAPIVGG